jgi:hypothetical protein
MTTETPPDWVLLEAARLSKYELPCNTTEWLRSQWDFMGGPFHALCDMIQKHEKPPVDRKLLCAREAMKSWVGGGAGPETICVRAIELWEEGFGDGLPFVPFHPKPKSEPPK